MEEDSHLTRVTRVDIWFLPRFPAEEDFPHRPETLVSHPDKVWDITGKDSSHHVPHLVLPPPEVDPWFPTPGQVGPDGTRMHLKTFADS